MRHPSPSAKEFETMISRRTLIPTVVLVAFFVLSLPMLASAQDIYGPWKRYPGSDNRNQDYRNDDRRYGGYDSRALRDTVRRVKDRSRDFQRHLDSALDRSRLDDSNREDQFNQLAADFRKAADDLKDRSEDGRNLNRSSNEARRLLQLGSSIDRFMQRGKLDSRTQSDWAGIRQDLQTIASIYGFTYGDFDDRYYRNDNRRNGGYYQN